ncbi:nucleoside ABC transporter membrane protein [Natranaerovirga hydrolytica]|uniref:Nucleoside ABC transporter membrane protein n=1 Tax=Natranaerovirga hydrolytica TaxID=680378 RepID=A0A4R1MWY5_9FIRM|nr:ABC transporter permease [Natranaerovirga hydrolytica]TCK97758.1 nucleoside ABC transporter membrane protein [Natranaerovirga hydrolytica]
MLNISKKEHCSTKSAYAIRMSAILLALVTASLFLLVLGYNPIEVYKGLLRGAFGTEHRIKETIIKTIPLVITSVGIGLAFKMKFWNIGAEGQIIMGAFAATYFALNFSGLPKGVLLPIMMIAAVIAGGIWAFIPAFFKAKYKTNETIFTLMLNYIALGWITYLQYGPWKDPNAFGFPKIPNYGPSATLPQVFGIHMGWIIALIIVIGMHLFINYTKKGYEITVIGESESTARYAKIPVDKLMMKMLFVSGGIIGLTGMIQASAVSRTLSVDITGGIGFTAIITAWLAGLKAPLMIIVCFLFSIMLSGASYIQTAFQIPQAAAEVLQGLILFFVLGSEFFIKYRIKITNTLFYKNREV